MTLRSTAPVRLFLLFALGGFITLFVATLGYSQGPQRIPIKTWSCSKCGRQVGTGDTPPNFDRCPHCGVRIRGARDADGSTQSTGSSSSSASSSSSSSSTDDDDFLGIYSGWRKFWKGVTLGTKIAVITGTVLAIAATIYVIATYNPASRRKRRERRLPVLAVTPKTERLRREDDDRPSRQVRRAPADRDEEKNPFDFFSDPKPKRRNRQD